MNHISDAPFAVACAEAGIFPSISIYSYTDGRTHLDYNALVDGLRTFRTIRGNSDFVFSMFFTHVFDRVLIKILKAADVKILEIMMPFIDYDVEVFLENLTFIKSEGFTCMLKVVEYDKKSTNPARNGSLTQHFDILQLKGNRGAGGTGSQSLEEMFFIAKNDFPDKQLVAAGGIYTKRQMDLYIKSGGALAVGIGTILAGSAESRLSVQTKLLMIEHSFAKVQADTYAEKNALVFKPIEMNDPNHVLSLKLGMSRPDLGGHIYCGEGIDSISSILTIKEIVNNLVM